MRPRTVGGGTRSPAAGPDTPTAGGTRESSPVPAPLPSASSSFTVKKSSYSVTATSARAKNAALQRQREANAARPGSVRGVSPTPAGPRGGGAGAGTAPLFSVDELSTVVHADRLRQSGPGANGGGARYRAPILRAPGIAPRAISPSLPPRLRSPGTSAGFSAGNRTPTHHPAPPGSAGSWWLHVPLDVRHDLATHPGAFQATRYFTSFSLGGNAAETPSEHAGSGSYSNNDTSGVAPATSGDYDLPWRKPCDVQALLSRGSSSSIDAGPGKPAGGDVAVASAPTPPALPPWESEWFGSQLRRGSSAISHSGSVGGSESATGIAIAGQGGIVRADHVHLAQSCLSAGRPCDALTVLHALASFDPAFGKAERQLLFDAATAFLDNKRGAVDNALRSWVAQHGAAAAAVADNGTAKALPSRSLSASDASPVASGQLTFGAPDSSQADAGPVTAATRRGMARMLLLDVAVPDFMVTTARVLRLLLHVLVPGAVAPGRYALVATALYSKWAVEFTAAAAKLALSVSATIERVGGLTEEPANTLQVAMLAPVVATLLDADADVTKRSAQTVARSRPASTTGSSSRNSPTALSGSDATHLALSAQATLSLGTPVAGALTNGLHVPPSSAAGTTATASSSVGSDGGAAPCAAPCLLTNCVSMAAQLEESCEVLLAADQPLRIALAVRASEMAKEAASAIEAAMQPGCDPFVAHCEAVAAAAERRLGALQFELETLEAYHQGPVDAATPSPSAASPPTSAPTVAPSKDGVAAVTGTPSPGLNQPKAPATVPSPKTHSRGAKVQATVLRELVSGARGSSHAPSAPSRANGLPQE